MYCIDSSALIAAWSERYPIEHFPRFWDALHELLASGRAIAPQEVFTECSKKSDDLTAWLKKRSAMFVELDEPIQIRAAAILVQFPRLVGARKARTSADAFVIALALERKLTLITEERPTGSPNRPNIPDVLAHPDFICPRLDLLGLIKAEKWIFG